MTTLVDDGRAMVAAGPHRRPRVGLLLALASAASFGAAGALARPALEAGWSAGALVLVRVGVAALVLLPLGLLALRGRWHLVADNVPRVAWYGVVAVAGTQFCYFSAVSHMQVGPALLIEFTAPAAIVLWLWLRHGERPGPMTLGGALVAAAGLMLVLDIFSGAGLSASGVWWALGAMLGNATYFVMSARADTGLPPLTLAAGGLLTGALALGGLGLLGLMPMHTTDAEVAYLGTTVTWWVPLAFLALVTAALAYTTGIGAARHLGSRLASFVALLEVLAGVGFAWLLLRELPGWVQLLGGLLILLGVMAVKLGEQRLPAQPVALPQRERRHVADQPVLLG